MCVCVCVCVLPNAGISVDPLNSPPLSLSCHDLSPLQVLEVVSATALFWHPSRQHPAGPQFVYEEERHAEDFFMPYIWALLVPRTPVSWDRSKAALLAQH